MTEKEIVLQQVEQLPDDCLDELKRYIRLLKVKAVRALAGESVLAQAWIRNEGDDAWET